MARKSNEQPPSRERERAFTSLDEINQAIAKLRGRISQVEELKKEGLPYLDALKVTAEFQIKEAIREIFGSHSSEYLEHQHFRIKSASKAEITATLAMIADLLQRLEDKKFDLSGEHRKPPVPMSVGQIKAPKESIAPPPSQPPAPSSLSHAHGPRPATPPTAPPAAGLDLQARPSPVAQCPPVSQPTALAPEHDPSGQSASDDRLMHALDLIRKICTRFHSVSRQLRQRGEYRTTLEVEDEQDARDVVQALLYLEFEDIRTDDSTPSYNGGASRTDLVIQPEGIVIVVRKTRQGLGTRELVEQVSIDSQQYFAKADCKTLFIFIYDPEGRIGNPRRLAADLTRVSDGKHLEVLIAPK